MNNRDILIVVPAYNEGDIMVSTLMELTGAGYTVVVVDDGSDVPVRNSVGHLPITILRHRVNMGQGAALQTAFAYVKKYNPAVVVTFDADGQHDAADIPAIVAPIHNKQADIVLGSRFLPGAGEISFSKKMVLQLARFINFSLSGALLSDAHNGFRALNPLALQKIELTENRMAHASEILFETRRNGLRFCEVPVHIRYTDYSKEKGQSGWDSIKILFDLVLHKLFK